MFIMSLLRTTKQIIPRFKTIQIKSALTRYRYSSTLSSKITSPTHKLIKHQTEYKQLPDDSMYIEKFHDELEMFHQEISTNKGITESNFTDFEKDPNAMIYYLEQYIESKIKPIYEGGTTMGRVHMERFEELLRNAKITLVLNGGHPMIFDVLLQSKSHFDNFVNKSKGK